MAGRYDITPLDTSTRQKLLNQYNQFSDAAFSQADLDALMGRYGSLEDQGMQDAWNAAQMEVSRQFSPAFDAIRARNYGLYGGGAGVNRDYSNLMQGLMGNLTGQRFSLGAESAARKAATLRALAQQRISGRQQMGSQLWDRALNTQKKPSTMQKIGSGVAQLGGAALGAFVGGPAGAAAGGEAASYFGNPNSGWYDEPQITPPSMKPIYTGDQYQSWSAGQRRNRGY